MSRLIDADALIEELNNSHFPGAPYVDAGISIAIGKVLDAPTIEPERKTGKWIHSDFSHEFLHCSECGRGRHFCSNFCPNCGAKMDGRE